ncbi:MAG: hypothetical protein GY718_04535, partial [Lentisphaerae bacterium]|nr:hypothetical protein [Lentisphaerota bacterium]
YKPQLSEGASRDLVIRMVLQIASTASVELKIDPTVVLASRNYVNSTAQLKIIEHEAKAEPHPGKFAPPHEHPYEAAGSVAAHASNLNVHHNNPNLLINGGFQVWQRGENFADVLVGTYTADRWIFDDSDGTSRANIIKNAQSNFVFEIADVGSATVSVLDQKVEVLNQSQPLQFTFSAMLKKSPGTSASITMYDKTGAPFASKLISDSNEFQTVSVTGTLPVNNSTVNSRFQINSPQNGQSLEIAWAKLESGVVATVFEVPNYTTELLKCQHYYWTVDNFHYLYDAKKSTTNSGPTSTSILFSTVMRTTPTITLKNPSGDFNVQSVTKYGFELRGNSWGQCSFSGFSVSAEI